MIGARRGDASIMCPELWSLGTFAFSATNLSISQAPLDVLARSAHTTECIVTEPVAVLETFDSYVILQTRSSSVWCGCLNRQLSLQNPTLWLLRTRGVQFRLPCWIKKVTGMVKLRPRNIQYSSAFWFVRRSVFYPVVVRRSSSVRYSCQIR